MRKVITAHTITNVNNQSAVILGTWRLGRFMVPWSFFHMRWPISADCDVASSMMTYININIHEYSSPLGFGITGVNDWY